VGDTSTVGKNPLELFFVGVAIPNAVGQYFCRIKGAIQAGNTVAVLEFSMVKFSMNYQYLLDGLRVFGERLTELQLVC
jgi:hypothetical protein